MAAILVLAVVVAVVWLIGGAPRGAEAVRATASPSHAVEYRMAQVKTATPRPTATAKQAATRTPKATATRTPAPTHTLVPTLPAPPTSAIAASLGKIQRIEVAAARAQVEAGAALFVDVRTAATYKQGHLPGAILLPGGVSTTGYSELPDNRLLIFY